MYLTYFGLDKKPFDLAPDPEFFYLSRGHNNAFIALEYALLERAAFALISGEVGCGKTTLIHYLLERLGGNYIVAEINNTQLLNSSFLKVLNHALNLDFSGDDEVKLYAQCVQKAKLCHDQGKRLLLIIDEVQHLTTDSLEKLRLVSNLNHGKELLIQTLLLGQPELRRQMASSISQPLRQRISIDYHLMPFNRQELDAYIAHRLSVAGRKEELFNEGACDLIYTLSRGVPRLINKICERALIYAFADSKEIVDASIFDADMRSSMMLDVNSYSFPRKLKHHGAFNEQEIKA